jgi:hypothetical protein
MKPNDVDLSEAGKIYLVANTPLFLTRRLQDDSSVDVLRRSCSGEDLYEGIVESLQFAPGDSVEAVRPFAYLIALRGQESPELFLKAARMRSDYHPWFKTVARALEATFVPHVNQTIWVEAPRPTISQFQVHSVSNEPHEAGKV